MPPPAVTRVWIALGSNQGDAPSLVRLAMDHLNRFSHAPIQRSSLYVSSPVDCPPGSPDFVNAVVLFTPAPHETPLSLLAKTQGLEREFGRIPKTILNEPRPLDVDIIDWNGLILDSPTLILPHPRAHLRRFVVEPIAEIDPDWTLPNQDLPAAPLLDTLRRNNPSDTLRRLP